MKAELSGVFLRKMAFLAVVKAAGDNIHLKYQEWHEILVHEGLFGRLGAGLLPWVF
ncbi:MAG: hypothetical protein PHP85_13720 [Gallionella sp.]|nr:hypothetical protein [Gallionella sp.]